MTRIGAMRWSGPSGILAPRDREAVGSDTMPSNVTVVLPAKCGGLVSRLGAGDALPTCPTGDQDQPTSDANPDTATSTIGNRHRHAIRNGTGRASSVPACHRPATTTADLNLWRLPSFLGAFPSFGFCRTIAASLALNAASP